MSSQLLDMESLFGLETEKQEEKKVEPKTKTKAPKAESPKEEDVNPDQGEQETKSADRNTGASGDGSGSPARRDVSVDSEESRTDRKQSVEPTGWHTNIIGKPSGRPNPYFQGIVATDGQSEEQTLIPFTDARSIQRQVYVDDITLENPTVLETIYRVSGTFPFVVARITEDVFIAAQNHPDLKHLKVNYSWVSDHLKKKRNYIVDHDKLPAEAEKQVIDKYEDQIEWATMPWHEKEKLKKDEKYQNMPKEEEVPLPVEPEDTQPEE